MQQKTLFGLIVALIAAGSAESREGEKNGLFFDEPASAEGPWTGGLDGFGPFGPYPFADNSRAALPGSIDAVVRPCPRPPVTPLCPRPIIERLCSAPERFRRWRPKRLLYDVAATSRPHWEWDCTTTSSSSVSPTSTSTTTCPCPTTTSSISPTSTVTMTCSCPTNTSTTTSTSTSTITSTTTVAPTSTTIPTTCTPCTVTSTSIILPEYVCTTIILCDIEGQSGNCLKRDELALHNLVNLALEPGAKIFVDGVQVQANSGSGFGSSSSGSGSSGSSSGASAGDMSAAGMNAKSSSAGSLQASRTFANAIAGILAIGLGVLYV